MAETPWGDLRVSDAHVHFFSHHFFTALAPVPGWDMPPEDLCSNVYLDTSSTNRWMLYEHLDLQDVFRRAIDVVGMERLLFGTDSSFFPRGWHKTVFEQQTKALYEPGLSAKQAEQILFLNLEGLYARQHRC